MVDDSESFEGYNEGAYRGGWNDDLQYMAGQPSGSAGREGRWQKGRLQGGPDINRGPYSGIGPRNYVRSDARILDEVSYRMMRHGHLDASHIVVAAREGVVQLEGKVHSRREKRLAEDIADTVQGVKDVDNRLRIETGG